VLTASERGASHVAAHTPNQDAVAVERAGTAGVVTAVADGHGHSRHLRSARGSRLAVNIGCRVGQELADLLQGNPAQAGQRQSEPGRAITAIDHVTVDRSAFEALASTVTASTASTASTARTRGTNTDDDTISEPSPDISAVNQAAALMREFLVPAIVSRWRDSVLADVAADPFTEKEERQRKNGDDPTIAYGSTLLLGLALGDWLILAQIGDGDVVGVQADGTAVQPIPADPLLDGLVTTSLCGPQAGSDFRIAVVDTRRTPLLAVLLATDGYGNAQVVEQWPNAFSRDLAWLLRERDMQWLAGQLPSWAARCASADGSADDTTVALLVSPAGQSARITVPPGGPPGAGASGQEPDARSEETTIPAVIHDDTAPSAQVPGGADSAEPITVRQPVLSPEPEPGPEPGPGPRAAASAETVRIAAIRPGVVGAETIRAETVRAEPVRAETLRAETLRAETLRAETLRAEPVRAETLRAETLRAGQDGTEPVTRRWEPPAAAAGAGA
jgi:hypothetical protein